MMCYFSVEDWVEWKFVNYPMLFLSYTIKDFVYERGSSNTSKEHHA